MTMPSLSRRTLLYGMGALGGACLLPGLALAAPATDKRLVVVILRGAFDGLAVVPPLGDRDYAAARGGLALSPGNGALALDADFGLNAGLADLKPLWDARELLFVHAIASPYRERSHFDGQNVLETGFGHPQGSADGWLNRALALLPQPADGHRLGLAVGPSVPLILRGPQRIAAWAPETMPELDPTFLDLLGRLYAKDPLLGPALADGIKSQGMSDALLGSVKGGKRAATRPGGGFAALAATAGKLLAAPDGARVAVMELTGWDTHAGQGTDKGRLANALTGLAAGLLALKDALGEAWRDTAVLAVTEFGRTVAENGTNGTDHGTGTAALVLGGRVRGGRVVTQWPGLAPAKLYQARDLMPTADLRGLLKAALQAQYGAGAPALGTKVFPDSTDVKPIEGLFSV
jgi:uncharacterized protein (DUF1501 family)